MTFNFNERTFSSTTIQTTTQEKIVADASRRLETIATQAMESKYWAGHNAADIQQLYRDLYNLGDLVKAHYFVEFKPHNNNDTRLFPLFEDNLSGFLVTETNLPIFQADYEQNKVGPLFFNTLNGIQIPDLQMSMIETKDARIMLSMQQWRELMVNDDGSLNPPASYAMEITIGMFSRQFGLEYKPYQNTYLVGPLLGGIDDLAARSYESSTIPLSFTNLRPYFLNQ